MSTPPLAAPGWPGIPPRWTSSAKTGVGTAVSATSRVWYTLSHGILNEVYYPRPDQAHVRDLGLIVTDGVDFFSEEKRHARSEIMSGREGIPAQRLINTCRDGRYRVEKQILADPRRDVVLQRIRFVALRGACADYHVYVLMAPHVANGGSGNTAWVGEYKGVPMLFAERRGTALALACSVPWLKRSAGFVGSSDGYQDLIRHREMTWEYARAENGNVALTAEVDLATAAGGFVLALGFGWNADAAGHEALASLMQGFDAATADYVSAWENWQSSLLPLARATTRDLYPVSTAILRTHEAKGFSGGIIASLSIPWGFAKGDEDLGGYHLIWPRDLVETAGALLAAGAKDDTRRVLHYLQVTQEADGHWPQNMWMEGTPWWDGVQMDETALPVLLVDLAWREGALEPEAVAALWPMVRRAAGFIARNGPVTQQDRWEEDPGYSPFTLAVEIAALLVAAELAIAHDELTLARYLRETADAWNASIDRWIYVTDTDWARQIGVDGYYVRIGPVDNGGVASPLEGFVPIKNRPPEQSTAPAAHLVSPDALALVRFGLRAANNPRIQNTVAVIDALLRVETKNGPGWRRYNGDGYGEHEDGSPFDGTGIGRLWPLLTGERGHYELAAGRSEAAEKLLRTMEEFVSEGGLLPEQVWDAADISERNLYSGRPTGSAMPLVWAHAEYVKLRRSLADGRVFDLPTQTRQRYLVDRTESPHSIWRFNHKCRTLSAGNILRLEMLAPAIVHWSADGWLTVHDTETIDSGVGVHVADLPTAELPDGAGIVFTFFWSRVSRWENVDFTVAVRPTPEPARQAGHAVPGV
jgi:glucoamylase